MIDRTIARHNIAAILKWFKEGCTGQPDLIYTHTPKQLRLF